MKKHLKFLVDGMLGSLAVKLRMIGFDTSYDRGSSDTQLLKIAQRENRILLTSDKELFLRAKHSEVECLLFKEKKDTERLEKFAISLGIPKLEMSKSRCSSCNGDLQEKRDNDRFGRSVYKCTKCGKEFWEGPHWKNLKKLLYNVNQKLSSA